MTDDLFFLFSVFLQSKGKIFSGDRSVIFLRRGGLLDIHRKVCKDSHCGYYTNQASVSINSDIWNSSESLPRRSNISRPSSLLGQANIRLCPLCINFVILFHNHSIRTGRSGFHNIYSRGILKTHSGYGPITASISPPYGFPSAIHH